MWNRIGEFVGNVTGAIKERFERKNDFHISHRLKGPKRQPGETFKEYRERLKEEKRMLKNYMKGEVLWPASRGTYIESEHGTIQSFRAQ